MLTWLSSIWNSLTSGDGFWQNRDQAYLAASVDSYDLERRIRQLDQKPRFG